MPTARLPSSASRLLLLLAAGLGTVGNAQADELVHPGGVAGTATETCVDPAGAVMSDQTVSWAMSWRFSMFDNLGYGWSQGTGGWYELYYRFGSLKAEWVLGDHAWSLVEGQAAGRVGTLSYSNNDYLLFEHDAETTADGTVIDGGWRVDGTDFSGPVPFLASGPEVYLDPATVTGASLGLTATGPTETCTWAGTIDTYVPAEVCGSGVDEDGDGLVDGADPDCQACGDGILDADEECDDGNRYLYDGCDAWCNLEPDSDGDGVPDSRDRCDGEDDTIDTDGNHWPDCLTDYRGDAAGGVATLWCYDYATGVTTTYGTELWEGWWDLTPSYQLYYYNSQDGTTEYVTHEALVGEWMIGDEVYPFDDGELYMDYYHGPNQISDSFALDYYHTLADGTQEHAALEIWDGRFLYGDLANGTVEVDIAGAEEAQFYLRTITSATYCQWEGTVDWYGANPSSDGDYVPDDVDACPDENAYGWDLDGDGCIDDTDGDGVGDDVDACPGGDDTLDDDGDGTPDACDACPGDALNDQDGDGLCTADDPCPFDPDDAANDSDLDGDGVCNIDDVCNASTAGWLGGDEDDSVDDDLDGIPDGCDLCLDLDGDGACTTDETCYRSGQGGDADADGACDTEDDCPLDYLDDSDGDGVCDSDDVCPGADDGPDGDGDGLPDCLDSCPLDPGNDGDGDGICEATDNCPTVPNPSQADGDGDGEGDACETDRDDDGVVDDADNCPDVANADQADADGDGAGDVCDADADGDGVTDATDACVGTTGGDPVLDTGCTVPQTCPEANDWKSNGAYVRCVSGAADELYDAGLITHDEWVDLTVAAAQSHAGGNGKR